MATSPLSALIQRQRRSALLHDVLAMPDGQLLEAFVNHRDDAAFAALVRRHGPMVMGVCRRLLRNSHDAEDAFQATFLVLVRKASSIASREQVANWLYGVAYNTALKAKAASCKMRAREMQVTDIPDPKALQQEHWQELHSLLDEELSRLPDKYRVPIVLCDLEGTTRRVAAEQLGCPEGTVAGRLARGRAMLARRLARRGVALSGEALALSLAHHVTSAPVPASLLTSTVQAATVFASGQAAAGAVSAKVAALTDGVVKAMLLAKLKSVTAVLLVAGMFASSGGLLTYHHTASAQLGQAGQSATVKATLKKDKGKRQDSEEAIEHDGGKPPKAIDPKVVEAWQKAGAYFFWYRRTNYGNTYAGFRNAKPTNRVTLPGFYCGIDRLKRGMIANLPAPSEPFALQFDYYTATDELLKELAGRLGNLQVLRSGSVTDTGLKELTRLKSLQDLEIGGTKVSDAGLKDVGRIKSLQYLDLNMLEVTDEGLKELVGLTNLKTLDLGRTWISSAGLEHLAGLENLRILVLFKTKVMDANLKHLAGLKSLQTLNLGYTKVTGVGLKGLAGLQKLQTLRIDNTALTDIGLTELVKLKNLQHLYMDHTKVTDAGLKELAGLKNLQHLYMDHTKVTDAGLKGLAGLKSLQTLSLFGLTAVTDTGVKHLAGLRNLETLNLNHTRATDAGMKELARLGNLQHLELSGTGVTDAGLKELSSLPSLQHLNLRLTSVTDAGLKELAGIKSLKYLNLRYTKATSAGIAELRKTHPNLQIDN